MPMSCVCSTELLAQKAFTNCAVVLTCGSWRGRPCLASMQSPTTTGCWILQRRLVLRERRAVLAVIWFRYAPLVRRSFARNSDAKRSECLDYVTWNDRVAA